MNIESSDAVVSLLLLSGDMLWLYFVVRFLYKCDESSSSSLLVSRLSEK